MGRAKKIILWSSATLLALLLLVVVVLATAGEEFYRWALAYAIEGTIDRKVHVDGTFSLDLGGHPTLVVTDAWLEDAAWTGKQEMARAKRVEIQVALKPLLSGIVQIPRLVIEGLTLDLEQSATGERNWDIGKPGPSIAPEALEEAVYPLFEFASVRDVTVTYRDEASGREIVVLLDSLEKQPAENTRTPAAIHADGSVNGRPFKVSAEIGSIEDAMSAAVPFPIKLEVFSTNFTLAVAGSIDNVPRARGLDLDLEFRSDSVYEMLRTLQIKGDVLGPARASLRLKGDLASLAAEDIDLAIAAPSGEEFKAAGRIADLVKGEGLDLRVDGRLAPASIIAFVELPPAAASIVEGLTDLRVAGHLTGEYERLRLEDLGLRLQHITGAEVAVEGSAKAEIFGEEAGLKEFTATAQAYLPDESLVDNALETRIPPMTDLSASAELAWAGDWVDVRSATLSGRTLENVQLTGKGKLGKLSGSDFGFDLDVRMDLKGTSPSSKPIFYLIEGFSPSKWRETGPPDAPSQARADLVFEVQRELIDAGFDPGAPDGLMGPKTKNAIEAYQRARALPVDGRPTPELLQRLKGREASETEPPRRVKAIPTFPITESFPEVGPVAASMRLLFKKDVFHFEDLALALGANGTEIRIAGSLGHLPRGPSGLLTQIDMDVSIRVPTSRGFAELLPSETPEFRKLAGRFEVKGRENLLSLSDIQITAEGPVGLQAAVAGGSTVIDLKDDPDVRELALNLDARWPDTKSVYEFVKQEVSTIRMPQIDPPELGPVHVRAILKEAAETFALRDLAASAGEAARPTLRITGSVADLPALAGVNLAGEFNVDTALLLRTDREGVDGDLGSVHGQFELSDADGSPGFEYLRAKVDDASLLSLSLEGLFDDIEKGDELRFAASLEVPDMAALGHRLNFNADSLGSLSYYGELSGSKEVFTATGDLKLGETEISGRYSGTLAGNKPALKGRIFSPLVRLVDLGMAPEDETLQEAAEVFEKEPTPPSDKWVFDEEPISFEALKLIDLDMDVVLKAVEGVRMEIDEISAKVTLADGDLKVDPLAFNFVGGQAEASLRADTREDQPRVHAWLAANNVDLGHLLSQMQVEVPLEGRMDTIVDLSAQGGTPRELASTLDGAIQLAIAEGQVQTGLLSLTTTNPIRWVFSESAREGYSDMNCLIMRFDVEDGLAQSRTLVLDTPNMRAYGRGQIDFRNEFLAIGVEPQAKDKRLIALSTPFAIEGRLADPSIKVGAAGASLRKSGEVLLSPLNLFGSLLPFIGDDGKDGDDPCLTLKQVPPIE